MHLPPVAEAHLVLGGVHVHIHLGRVQFQVQHESRVAAVVEHVAVSLLDGVGDQLVADHPAVDEEILQVCLAAGEGGQAHPAPQPETGPLVLHVDGLLHEGGAAHGGHPALALGLAVAGLEVVERLAVVTQVEGHVETGQGQALHHLFQVVELGFLGAQELAPCGGVEEQVAHFHRGAPGMGGGLHLHLHIAALALGAGALTGAVVGIAGEGQARHGADTGQCLAAETQAADPFQVFQRFDLAGGMAGQCQGQLVGGDAGPVVADTDQLAAAGLHLDIHPGGAGVQAVFQYLLHHRGGALDHLAGGDLVGQAGGQDVDFGHGVGLPIMLSRGKVHQWCAVRTLP